MSSVRPTPLLTVHGLHAGYHPLRPIVQDISFTLEQGEALAVLGPNGSGKSTLLRALAGLLPHTGGHIQWQLPGADRSVQHLAPHQLLHHGISYVPQGGLLMPELSVQEHLELAVRHRPKADRGAAIAHGLEAFPRIKDLLKRRGGMLSGGERQQLSAAILLAQGTRVWLLDEPTAGLSPALVQDTLAFLREHHAQGITLIVVEHDLEVAFRLAHRLLVMREGRIVNTLQPQSRNEPIPTLELIYT